MAAVLVGLTALFCLPAPARAADPVRCHIGAFIVSLRDFNVSEGSYVSDLWLWSVCPDKRFQPLKTLEFTNATEVTASLYAAQRVKGAYWAEEKVTGTFRYNWDLGNFPFDHHSLLIELEDSYAPISSLRLDPDTAGSGVTHDLSLQGWRVVGFTMGSALHHAETSFGFPGEAPRSGETFSQVRINVSIDRTDYSRLILLTIVPFLSIILAFASRLLPILHTDVRMDSTTVGIFAVVVSLLAATESLGTVLGVSLVGEVHIIALIFILAVALMNIYDRRRIAQGAAEAEMERADVRSVVVLSVSYVLVNAVFFGIAIHNS